MTDVTLVLSSAATIAFCVQLAAFAYGYGKLNNKVEYLQSELHQIRASVNNGSVRKECVTRFAQVEHDVHYLKNRHQVHHGENL